MSPRIPAAAAPAIMTAAVGCAAALCVTEAAALAPEVDVVEIEVAVDPDVVPAFVIEAVDMVDPLGEAVPVDATERSEATMAEAWLWMPR